MDNWIFWILVFPLLLLMALYYLGFLTAGLSFIGVASKRSAPKRNLVILIVGLLIAAAPFIAGKIQRTHAERQADLRQAEIANFDRVSLKTRMPKKFVAVSRSDNPHLKRVAAKYGLRPFHKAEEDRLRTAYIQYRRGEHCHRRSPGKMMSEKIQIPVCREIPPSIQDVLNLREPVLFFAADHITTHQRSRIGMGKRYELRLLTPREDRLVDYFEQRTIRKPVGITNPFGSGWILDRDHEPPRLEAFLENALRGETIKKDTAK